MHSYGGDVGFMLIVAVILHLCLYTLSEFLIRELSVCSAHSCVLGFKWPIDERLFWQLELWSVCFVWLLLG